MAGSGPTMENVTQRLDRLEREVRWWRRLGGLSLAIAGVLALMGQARPGPKIVEGEAFVLKDVKGKVRAVLGPMRPSDPPPPTVDSRLWQLGVPEPLAGQYGLHFYGSDGAYRAGLSQEVYPAEAWLLQLRSRGTASEARIRVADGGAALALRGTLESREAVARAHEEWLKSVNEGETPGARAKAATGPVFDGVEASLTTSARGGTVLSLQHRLGGGMDFDLRDRRPTLSMEDETRALRAVLGHTKLERVPVGLILFDKDGKAIRIAP